MTTGKRLAAAAAALTVAGPVSTATADGTDCSLLADLAERYTIERLREFTGRHEHPQPAGQGGIGRLRICDRTAQAASGGFSAAMRRFGMPVRWSFESESRSCSAPRLSLCGPFGDLAAAALSPAERRFAASTWAELRRVLVAHMPRGEASDLSCFSAESLTQSLGPGRAPGRGLTQLGGSF